ncbi:hypothetical protein PoB_005598000 [Plakobranchus ocellatus]|uniref:Uncharacterized protein n=1 Tax=Plakobranchus ocellatus TaxID=259542 RepID=A0AAV4CDI4_9GAST|nr:hypothetical protein PoB_005598000 [Plakobranchus ocellatus]
MTTATMTIDADGDDVNDDYDLRCRMQAHRTSSVTVVEDSKGCRNVRPSKAAHTLSPPRPGMKARVALHSHTLSTVERLSSSRAHSRQRPEYRALTRHCHPNNQPGARPKAFQILSA